MDGCINTLPYQGYISAEHIPFIGGAGVFTHIYVAITGRTVYIELPKP
jgi:hypothetical protein